jgi:hypothetical protein
VHADYLLMRIGRALFRQMNGGAPVRRHLYRSVRKLRWYERHLLRPHERLPLLDLSTPDCPDYESRLLSTAKLGRAWC